MKLIITSILSGKKDFCCLCLKPLPGDPIHIDDVSTVDINGVEQNIEVSEALRSIFDTEIYNDYITAFDSLCETCTKSAISCYKFIQESQKKAEYLKNILFGITNTFENTVDECSETKTMFVLFNIKDSTSETFYTKQKVSGQHEALQRFNSIVTMESLKEEIKKEVNKKINIDILLKDMMLDVNNPDKLICKVCFKEFPNILKLYQHYITTHVKNKFRCQNRLKEYTVLSHSKANKSDQSSLVCSECGKTFTNRRSFNIHVLHHNHSIICTDCGRVYKSKQSYKKHKESKVCSRKTRANPSEAKLTCDYCNKKYTQKVSLRVHIQHEHGNYKNHICEWCGKKFWAPSRLKAHIVKHTQEKNFLCSMCDRKFVTKESLLYHTRIHTGERPFKCPHCECRFLSASRRTFHVKLQHSNSTHECDLCQSKFSTRQFLMKHKRNYHSSSGFEDNIDDECNKMYHEYPVHYVAPSRSVVGCKE